MRLEPNFFAEISICRSFVFYVKGYNGLCAIFVYTFDPSYPWSILTYT